jgi:aminopeptidase N
MNSNSERITKAISTVENTIKIFNEQFGKYPYSSYSIVETHFPTGMEYPGLSFIPNSYFNGSKSILGLEGVIVHETAHQWWYGIVGNNQIDEAWLDEGLATYSKVIYFEKTYGHSFGKDYYEKNIHSIYENKRKSIKGKEILLKPLNEFDGWREYDTLAYKKGAVLFQEVRNEVGDEKFFDILKKYYNNNKFKNVNTQDFINTVEAATNRKWEAFFEKWLLGK